MSIDPIWQKLSWKKIFALNLIIFCLYVFLGSIYFSFPADPINYYPLWIPSGFSMAMVCIFGLTQTFPGLFAGMFLIAIQSWEMNFVTLGIVFANFLEVVIATTFLKLTEMADTVLKVPRIFLPLFFWRQFFRHLLQALYRQLCPMFLLSKMEIA